MSKKSKYQILLNRLDKAIADIRWCSGASDFQQDGEAVIGWRKVAKRTDFSYELAKKLRREIDN